jgi:pilus assembly protein Flp/PilA
MPSHRDVLGRITAGRRDGGRLLGALLRDRSGATAIEYSLIASLIAMVIIGAIASTGDSVQSGWDHVASEVVGALSR